MVEDFGIGSTFNGLDVDGGCKWSNPTVVVFNGCVKLLEK